MLRDGVDLPSFNIMERAGADRCVDRFWAELAHRGRSAGKRKQPARAQQRGLVAGANGDDTGEKQFEWGVKALLSEFEERRLRVCQHCVADAIDRHIDIERPRGWSLALAAGSSAPGLLIRRSNETFLRHKAPQRMAASQPRTFSARGLRPGSGPFGGQRPSSDEMVSTSFRKA